MEEERDIVVFKDDDGNEFELEVIDYFEHEGQEYAVLMDPVDVEECECEDKKCECDEECECDDDEECGDSDELYIMKIVTNGDEEEFLPADDDKLDELIKIVEARFDECGCDCDDDDCDCGCHDHDHCDCDK